MLFDLDGVLTRTADLHAAAWQQTFDTFLQQREEPQEPFDIDRDYRRYVDGKPRYEGVAAFLAARGIELPWGDPGDPSGHDTVCALGNRKNERFRQLLEERGASLLPGAKRLLRATRAAGFGLAVVSSSRNAGAVLAAAGLADACDVLVDGLVSARLGLAGKPAPDTFLEAARQLGVDPRRAAVWEDALAGVEAGRAGGFGLVVGVGGGVDQTELREHGADVVVSDLGTVHVETDPPNAAERLPSALDDLSDLLGGAERIAVFLDYDGTLTPIVRRPEDAVLAPETRAALRTLAERCLVAVVSGRDLADVRRMVGVDELIYAGSHGFDIRGPGPKDLENRKGEDFLEVLDAAEERLTDPVSRITGARVERKRYSIAVHFREVAAGQEREVESAVDAVLAEQPRLRKGTGKKIFELLPDLDWNKGRAVLWLLRELELDPEGLCVVYLGDDVTDEDAFRALWGRGVGVLVRDEPRATWARYALENTEQTRRFLERLAGRLEGRRR